MLLYTLSVSAANTTQLSSWGALYFIQDTKYVESGFCQMITKRRSLRQYSSVLLCARSQCQTQVVAGGAGLTWWKRAEAGIQVLIVDQLIMIAHMARNSNYNSGDVTGYLMMYTSYSNYIINPYCLFVLSVTVSSPNLEVRVTLHKPILFSIRYF